MFGNLDGGINHFSTLKGYQKKSDGTYNYIFDDVAGNRVKNKLGQTQYNMGRDKGENVRYSKENLNMWGVKGDISSFY